MYASASADDQPKASSVRPPAAGRWDCWPTPSGAQAAHRHERHLRSVMAEYARHYNGRRPHRARRLQPSRPDHPVADLSQERVKRRPVLGGLLSEYERAGSEPRSRPLAQFWHPTGSGPATSSPPCGRCRPAATWSRWWATASTTSRPSSRQISVSRWDRAARRAARWPGWCCWTGPSPPSRGCWTRAAGSSPTSNGSPGIRPGAAARLRLRLGGLRGTGCHRWPYSLASLPDAAGSLAPGSLVPGGALAVSGTQGPCCRRARGGSRLPGRYAAAGSRAARRGFRAGPRCRPGQGPGCRCRR